MFLVVPSVKIAQTLRLNKTVTRVKIRNNLYIISCARIQVGDIGPSCSFIESFVFEFGLTFSLTSDLKVNDLGTLANQQKLLSILAATS